MMVPAAAKADADYLNYQMFTKNTNFFERRNRQYFE